MHYYFIQIENNKIISKGVSGSITNNQIEVTKEIYDQLTRLPADFETDTEGNIISVTPAPEPEPEPQDTPTPTLAELQAQQLAQAEAIAAIFEMLTGGEA
jgi:hypothetical protein